MSIHLCVKLRWICSAKLFVYEKQASTNKKASLPLALGLGLGLRKVMPFIYGAIHNGHRE